MPSEAMFFAAALPADDVIRQTAAAVVQRPDYNLEPIASDGLTVLDVILWLLTPLRWLFGLLSNISPVLAWVVTFALVILLVALLAHIAYAFRAALQKGISLKGFPSANDRESIRPEVFEEKAQAAFAERNYIAAIRFLFRASLLRLAQAEKNSFRRGATNREYLRRYRNTPAFESMRLFVEIIDAKWYGQGMCVAEDYEACLLAHARIRQMMKEIGMLTARSVVIATITVAVLSIVGSCISLMRTLDNGGQGRDSYGTRAHGYRALFETLHDLNVPVERLQVPPTEALARPVTLVLCAPNADLVQIEPIYLRQVKAWVEQGGRVVVSPAIEDYWTKFKVKAQADALHLKVTSLLEELGLPDVAVEAINLPGAVSLRDPRLNRDSKQPDSNHNSSNDALPDLEALKDLLTSKASAVRTVSVKSSGELAFLERSVSSLEVPESDLQVIDASDVRPAGQVTFQASDGQVHTLVASYRYGKGEIIVVGDPALFQNRHIAAADNILLASRLLAVPGRTIAFDEFYHGLTIRGNPLWLMSRVPYAFLALSILAATGLWAWRESVFPGPALQPGLASRRSLAEYIESMARFFQRGRSGNSHVLREVRDGTLRALRNELRLRPGQETLEHISSALARKQPHTARQLIEAVTCIDAALSTGKRCDEKTTVNALQRISACL